MLTMNTLTAAYGSIPDRNTLDLMLPETPGPHPVVVIVHGGGWREGSKAECHRHARMLLPLGIASVMPNYRLTTTHSHPAQQDDILAVLDWVAAHAAEHALDPQRVALHGWSAGGHLVAQVGLLASRPAPNPRPYRLRCVHPVCGVHDVSQWLRDCPQYTDEVRGLSGGETIPPDASPVTHVHPHAPPFRITHGTEDWVVPHNQSELLHAALCRAGIPSTLVLVPDAIHTSIDTARPDEPLGGIAGFHDFFRTHLLTDT